MTDSKMDARLRRAGEAWRNAVAGDGVHIGSLQPPDLLAEVPSRAPRRWPLAASAALVAAALVTAGAFLFAGGTTPRGPAADASLRGTVWRLVQVGEQPPRQSSYTTFYIGKDDRFVADDSCQVTGGHADTSGGTMQLRADDVRYWGCVDASGEVSFVGRAMDTLLGSPAFRVDGSRLTLEHAGDPTLHFVAAPELAVPTTDVPTFLGAKWQLIKVTDAAGTSHPVAGSPTLQVKNGRLTAAAGCNSLTAHVVQAGQQVELEQVKTTRAPCPNKEEAAIGQVVERVLAGPTAHEQVEGTQLTLKGNGVGALVYRWLPDDPAATDPARFPGKWRLRAIAGEPAAGGISFYASPVELSIMYGCGAAGGSIRLSTGELATSGFTSGPAAGCSGARAAQSATVDSFFATNPVLWSIRNGDLVIYGGGAQAFSLVWTPAG